MALTGALPDVPPEPPAAAAVLLGAQQVEAAVEQPAGVAEVGLLLLGLAAAGAQLVDGQVLQAVEEALGQHVVDPASATRLRLHVTDRRPCRTAP